MTLATTQNQIEGKLCDSSCATKKTVSIEDKSQFSAKTAEGMSENVTLKQRSKAIGAAAKAIEKPKVASSSSPASTRDKRGIDDDGTMFDVPETASVMHTLVYPSLWSGPSLIVLCSLIANVLVAFLWPTSAAYQIGIFILFRSAYNIGFGILLHYQSKYRTITRAGKRIMSAKNSRGAKIMKVLARARMTHIDNFDPDEYPACFNTWLAFRFIVDIVLCNDGLSYLIVVVKCWNAPDQLTFSVIAQYLVGFGLAAFNYWAKVDAHRCIGAYSWYWADCFFLLQQHLTFDGVFELFPHPMYTVGYSLYYGAALMARSYVVLFVSLAAHLMQLSFLIFFENPHIERTYGHAEPDKGAERILYDASEGLFPRKADSIFFFRLDLFRSSDIALVLLSIYAIIITILLQDARLAVLHLFSWIFLHWVGVGLILKGQSNSGWWTRHFTSRGRTLHEAFTSWKVFYNTTRTVSLVAFVACSVRFAWYPTSRAEITARWASFVAMGVALVFINVYSSISSYMALGDFAFFYGDFFIDFFRPETRYNGIYRFLNNPDCVTGYAAMHGLALIAHSWTMFFVALAAQAANILFVELVEVPHMQKIYKESEVRKQNPINVAIKRGLIEVLPDELVEEADRIQRKAIEEVYGIYANLALRGAKERPADQCAMISAPKTVFLHQSMSIQYTSPSVKSQKDWIGIYGVNVPTLPGVVHGRYLKVPESKEGEVTFLPEKMPLSPGVYELRYVTSTWAVAAVTPFCIVLPPSSRSASRRSSQRNSISERSDSGESSIQQ